MLVHNFHEVATQPVSGLSGWILTFEHYALLLADAPRSPSCSVETEGGVALNARRCLQGFAASVSHSWKTLKTETLGGIAVVYVHWHLFDDLTARWRLL